MERAKECISVYCKTEAQLNIITKQNEAERTEIQERILTNKSVLMDEMKNKNISCVEVNLDGEPGSSFLRLQQKTHVNVTPGDVINILEDNLNGIGSYAEESGHDIPKMMSALIKSQIKQKKQQCTNSRCTLTFSSSKERGFSKESGYPSSEFMGIAKDLLKDKSRLTGVRKRMQEERAPILEQQKAVEDDVKKALRIHDPQKKTQKVQMSQGGVDSVFYLRCREKEVKPKVGIRKIIPVVENATNICLEEFGLSRDFTPSSPLPLVFWTNVLSRIKEDVELLQSKVTSFSKLSLDRSAFVKGS